MRIAAGTRRAAAAGIALALTLAAPSATAATSASAAAPHRPACFGAASRDPYRRCDNPRLKDLVIPTPDVAQITPSSPCTPIHDTEVNLCWFGRPLNKAVGVVALLGDSHAQHWRAALQTVADQEHWFGLSSTRDGCPFSLATTIQPEPARGVCSRWNKALIVFFRQHPAISTIFESNHPGVVYKARGQTLLEAQIAGAEAMWRALPKSIKHIVVIRDIPYMRGNTYECVDRAIAKHTDAGVACAVPRSQALHADPFALAAWRLRSPRIQVIDLTQFFCDSRLCYPVIGGSLAYRDSNHLTTVFAGTLGPFLAHALGHLMRTWY